MISCTLRISDGTGIERLGTFQAQARLVSRLGRVFTPLPHALCLPMLPSLPNLLFSARVALLASLLLFATPQLSFVSGSPSESPVRRATTCNGSSDLCNRSFGNVTFVGTHDSYAVGVDNCKCATVSVGSPSLSAALQWLRIRTTIVSSRSQSLGQTDH